MNEEELLLRAQENDPACTELLLMRYKPLVRKIARRFALSGEDTDDLIQEGMLALWKAILTYSRQKNAAFATYASHCVRNKMIDALHALPKEKYLPLNEVLAADNGEDGILEPAADPLGGYIDKEDNDGFLRKITEILSQKQSEILALYLKGYAYGEIAEALNIPRKAVDNALAAAKAKIKKNLNP